jgi:hypothetical protein
MGKLVLKMKIKGMRQHDCESSEGFERKCLKRRCKSYRRKAMMTGDRNDVTSATYQKDDREPEISELVETMTIDDIKIDDGEERDILERRERKRACKHRKSDDKDDVTDENTNSEKTKKKCLRRRKGEDDKADGATGPQDESAQGHEDAEGNGSPLEGKFRRRCKAREQDFGILTLSVGMNGDLKIKPRKLARKLYRLFNQYSTDFQEDMPYGVRQGYEEFKGCRGRDSERQFRRMLRRQERRREKARDLDPDCPPRSCWGGVRAPRLRKMRRRDCPW